MHENLLCQRWQRLDCSDRMAAKHSSNYSLPVVDDDDHDDDNVDDDDDYGGDDDDNNTDYGLINRNSNCPPKTVYE